MVMNRSNNVRCFKLARDLQEHLLNVFRNQYNAGEYQSIIISFIEVSRDLSFADIYLKVSPEDSFTRLQKKLKKESSRLRFQLTQRLAWRKMPKLRFHRDTFLDDAEEIEKKIVSLTS